jgi:hypothetical protein
VSDTIGTILLLFGIGAIFTNFYGLFDLWENRGSWYTVSESKLPEVMANLSNLNAFKDSDGLDTEMIKIRASVLGSTVYYDVKVPNRIFKYQEIKMDDEAKFKLLGL